MHPAYSFFLSIYLEDSQSVRVYPRPFFPYIYSEGTQEKTQGAETLTTSSIELEPIV